MTSRFTAYTDGSGTFSQRPCGSGVVIYDGDEIIAEASRFLGPGTNNHAELSAVRLAVHLMRFEPLRGHRLTICSDSQYAIHMCSRRGELDPFRPNAALINIIRRMMVGLDITFEHVKGHSGLEGNERADVLASIGRRQAWLNMPKKNLQKPPAAPHHVFGQALRAARGAMPTKRFARAMGMLSGRITALELGTDPPPSDVMVRAMARSLGLDPSALLHAAQTARAAWPSASAAE